MNFAERIKQEILSKNITDKQCRQAFLAGIIRGSGVLYEKDGELGVEFKAPDEQTAITFTNSFKLLYNYDIREVSVSEDKLNKKDKEEEIIRLQTLMKEASNSLNFEYAIILRDQLKSLRGE